jgi:plastocyanin
MRRAGCALISSLALLAVAVPASVAAMPEGKAVAVSSLANGAKRIKYRIGPFNIVPGQNQIGYEIIHEKPQEDGYFTRIRPDLTYLDARVPGVDVIHLHHGVWLNLGRSDRTHPGFPERFMAAGEEKTRLRLPKGYGYPVRASDTLLLNHMIHNLTPVPTQVYMVYEVDFVPANSRAARGLRPVHPVWMDVQNGSQYPVFNVQKGSGRKGRYTYPNDAGNPYGSGGKANEWVVDRPGVLVATAGHLHPGGLYTDLNLRRRGARIKSSRKRGAPRGRGNTAHLFRSVAKYYEPAGAVSWDVAMTGTRLDWRVRVRRGDVLTTSASYDTTRAAWWESMGIMVVYMADGGSGRNPFRKRVDFKGSPTHGHLRENNNHGGAATSLPDPRQLPDGSENPGNLDIVDFKYQFGDMSLPGQAGLPPVIRPGQTLNFRNRVDNQKRIYHSITSCKAPCNRSTGIAYPIADGSVQFESSTLGSAVPPATGALEWKTPDNLQPGTYTYFCRIHPFMRGAFRVKQ